MLEINDQICITVTIPTVMQVIKSENIVDLISTSTLSLIQLDQSIQRKNKVCNN